jgi:hypothetical protein
MTIAQVEDLGYTSDDVLWSPDSKAFFVNGSHAGASEGYFVYVFRLEDPELRPIEVTRQAQRDMVRSFPPCKAAYLDKKTCESLEADPRYNMSGLDWVNGSAAIVVLAEIPDSSYYGGIMSQGVGYELEVPTGRILKKMSAREFAVRWQRSMAWKFRVSEPPEYCPAVRIPATPKCD